MKNKRTLLITLCLCMMLTSCGNPVNLIAVTVADISSVTETTAAVSHTSAMTTVTSTAIPEATSFETTTETVRTTSPTKTKCEDNYDYDWYVDPAPDGVMTTAETEPWYAAIWFTTDVLDIEPYWDTTTAASETNEILYAPPETYLTENTTAPATTTYETTSKPKETTTTTTASTTIETETPEIIEHSEEFIDDYTRKYYGEIRPCEERGLLSDKIKEAEAELSVAKEKLITEFPKIAELFVEVQLLQSKVDTAYMVNEFGKGLALGIRMGQVVNNGT